MDKQQVYEFLKTQGIEFDIVEHEALFTVAEVFAAGLPEQEAWAKNLFLCDDKKRNFYMITMPDEKRADLRTLREILGTRRLKFASEENLMRLLGLIKGSVTPLGVLNDEDRVVKIYIDSYFRGRRISIHPNDNTASVYLDCDDLVRIIEQHGNPVEYIDL